MDGIILNVMKFNNLDIIKKKKQILGYFLNNDSLELNLICSTIQIQ